MDYVGYALAIQAWNNHFRQKKQFGLLISFWEEIPGRSAPVGISAPLASFKLGFLLLARSGKVANGPEGGKEFKGTQE